MGKVTEADREAAKALRDILAEVSGFWHTCGDESALCLALARHRIEAERRVSERSARYGKNPLFFGFEGANDFNQPACIAASRVP